MPKEAVQVFRQTFPAMPQIPWASGRFYTCPFTGSITSGISLASDLRATPIYVPNTAGVTVTTIGLEVTSAGTAGHKLRLGIYSDKDGWPDALLLDSGQLAVDSAAFQSAAVSKFLQQGWYWLASIAQSGQGRCASSTAIPRWMGMGSPKDTNENTGVVILLPAAQDDDWALGGLPGGFPKITTGAAQLVANGLMVKLGI